MDTIRELLATKHRQGIVVTSPGATVREATTLMNDHGIGSLLVIRDRRLVGIFTERDVLRRVVAAGRPPEVTPVGEVMTNEVLCCGPHTGVEEVADLMRRHRVRHVPVVDADDEVLGLVSIGDVNAWRFASCETVLHQMEEYLYRRA